MSIVTHRIEQAENATVLVFSGRIDLSNCKDVRAVILSALEGEGDILIDLVDIDYIDSSGIAHLVEGFQRAKGKGRKFGITQASDQVRSVLKITRLDSVLMI